MAKISRIINGVIRSYTADGEVSLAVNDTSKVVTFPAELQGETSTPKVHAWFINTTDSSPQFQPITITARSSTGFTASWNAGVDSNNYKLAYAVLDGFDT